jgi:hypothetical protein
MNTIALKEKINKKIALIEDDSFLKAINLILDSKTKNQKYVLSEYQVNRVKESDEDERFGKLISDKDLQVEIDQWLSLK